MANNYINGKGKLYFASFIAGSQNPGGERFLGNAPAFSISFEQEQLDHYASTGGVKQKDGSVTLQINRSGTMEIDDIQHDNLALFFFGTASNLVQAAGSVTDELIMVDAKDRYYQLGVTSGAPNGARSVSAVVVTDNAGTLTYVAGTDYVVDAANGRIYVPAGSAIVPSTSVAIKVDYTKAAKTIPMIISGKTPIEGSLRFIADNPAGENVDYFMPYVKITPNGEFNILSEEWLKLSFKVEVLIKSGSEAVYANGVPF